KSDRAVDLIWVRPHPREQSVEHMFDIGQLVVTDQPQLLVANRVAKMHHPIATGRPVATASSRSRASVSSTRSRGDNMIPQRGRMAMSTSKGGTTRARRTTGP